MGVGSALYPLKTDFKVDRSINSFYTGGSISLSLSGEYLITTEGHTVNILDYASNKILYKIGALPPSEFNEDEAFDSVTAFKLNESLGLIYIAHQKSLLVRIWSIKESSANPKLIKELKAHEHGPVLIMDINDKYLLTGSADNTIKLWELQEDGVVKQCINHYKGHSGIVTKVLFHNDRDEFYSSSEDGTVRIWSLVEKKCLATFANHSSVVTSLCLSPNKKYLVSAGRDKMIYVWNLVTRKCEKSILVLESIESIVTLLSSPSSSDDWEIASGGETGELKIWSFKTEKLTRQESFIKGNSSPLNGICSILYHAKNQELLTINYEHYIFISNSSTLQPKRVIIGNHSEITDIVYLTNDDSSIAFSTNSNAIRVYDGFDDSSGNLLFGHNDIVLCLASNPNHGLLLSGSKDGSARLWKMTKDSNDETFMDCIAVCHGHQEAIGAVGIAHHGGFIITASQDKTIKLWDISLIPHAQSKDYPVLLQSKYTIKAHEKDINGLDISPNDKLILTASQDKSLKLWSAFDGSLKGAIPNAHKRSVWSVAFSNKDQCFASSSADKTIKLWSVQGLSCLKTFEGHTNSILKVRFINSGTQLLSASSDGLIKIWDLKSNECLNTFDQHMDKIWALTISNSNARFMSGGADAVLNIWKDVTEEQSTLLYEQKANLILKDQEYMNYYMKKDYKNAIYLTLTLKQPHRLLNLLKEAMKHRIDESALFGSVEIDDIFRKLNKDELAMILTFIREWNVVFKHATVAQSLLHIILKAYPQHLLLSLSSIKEILNGLIPYSERHFNKIDEALIQFYLIDLTLFDINSLVVNYTK